MVGHKNAYHFKPSFLLAIWTSWDTKSVIVLGKYLTHMQKTTQETEKDLKSLYNRFL